MNGIEAGIAADRSEMEGRSAAEEMNQRARNTSLKVNRAVAVVVRGQVQKAG